MTILKSLIPELCPSLPLFGGDLVDQRRAQAQKILMTKGPERFMGNGTGTGSRKEHLDHARREKNDEFYTLYDDVEAELSEYSPDHFRGKVVFCNCDDPTWSAFFEYFVLNFKHLGLKELLTTHYEPLLGNPSYALRYNGKIDDLTDDQFLDAIKGGGGK